jgi:excinuclease UvrABC nuclease subunit
VITEKFDKSYYKWFIGNDYSKIIPKQPGCYAIYTYDYFNTKEKNLVYVGTASNLKARLIKHEIIRSLRSLSNNFVVIKCKIIRNDGERLETEKKLIGRLQPKANRLGIYNG